MNIWHDGQECLLGIERVAIFHYDSRNDFNNLEIGRNQFVPPPFQNRSFARLSSDLSEETRYSYQTFTF